MQQKIEHFNKNKKNIDAGFYWIFTGLKDIIKCEKLKKLHKFSIFHQQIKERGIHTSFLGWGGSKSRFF